MKTYNNNIYEVIEIIDNTTGKTKTVQVIYKSRQQRYYLPDQVPERIQAFMRWSRCIKEYPVYNSNRTTKHYY